jgi:proton-translocating NADH-quinone oxidoreductase chain N
MSDALVLLAQAPPPPEQVLEMQKAMEERMIADLPYLAPIGCLAAAAIGGVAVALLLPAGRQVLGAWYVGALHVGAALAAALVWTIGGFRTTMEGTVIVDGTFLAATGIIGIAGAVAVALLRSQVAGSDRESELYAVLAATSLGSIMLAAANDAALLALALGLVGIGSYVLTGYLRRAERSNEAALKFYIYGTVAGATMVYGLTWWFGFAGTTDLGRTGAALVDSPDGAVLAATALFFVGLAFKASLVPFHFWTPDTYEGAPTAVAAFLSVVPKAGALVALARVLPEVLPDGHLGWPTAIGVVAAATMLFGAAAMFAQRNVVRLLAYSSISQSGFLLIGVAAFGVGELGLSALLYYLAAYAATNLAAFAVVIAVERESGSVEIKAFAGLARRHPWWTAGLVLSLLSLVGIPPLAGFVGKLEVFTAAIDSGMVWLAVVGIIATVVSLYPYLRVIAPAVLDEPAAERGRGAPSPALVAAALVAAVATVGVGVGAEPFLGVAADAVSGVLLMPVPLP